jgi:hypothetical protein
MLSFRMMVVVIAALIAATLLAYLMSDGCTSNSPKGPTIGSVMKLGGC